MSLSTLAALKTDLGVSGSSEDSRLTSLLRQACAIVRAECKRYFGGTLTGVTAANPAVVTSVGHGLISGQAIVISGADGASASTINAAHVVTVTSADAFTIPIDLSAGAAATTGNYVVRYTEFYGGDGTHQLVLRQTPVTSVASVYSDSAAHYGEAAGAFASSTLLTAGTDYCLQRDGTGGLVSESGILLRIGDHWRQMDAISRDLLVAGMLQSDGTIKVTYDAGYAPIPSDLVSAVHQLAANLRLSADKGGAMQSESLDYYSYTRMSPEDQAKAIGSVRSILKRYKAWSF